MRTDISEIKYVWIDDSQLNYEKQEIKYPAWFVTGLMDGSIERTE